MFKVYKEACKNCLLSGDRIVSKERAGEILQKVQAEQSFFICHVSSMEGGEVCCANFYQQMGHVSQLARIAERLGMVELVEMPETERLISHREIEKKHGPVE